MTHQCKHKKQAIFRVSKKEILIVLMKYSYEFQLKKLCIIVFEKQSEQRERERERERENQNYLQSLSNHKRHSGQCIKTCSSLTPQKNKQQKLSLRYMQLFFSTVEFFYFCHVNYFATANIINEMTNKLGFYIVFQITFSYIQLFNLYQGNDIFKIRIALH